MCVCVCVCVCVFVSVKVMMSIAIVKVYFLEEFLNIVRHSTTTMPNALVGISFRNERSRTITCRVILSFCSVLGEL